MSRSGEEPKESWDAGRGKPVPYGKSPHRTPNPLSGTELDEADRQRLEGDQPPPYVAPAIPHRPKSKSKTKSRKQPMTEPGAPPERLPLTVIILFAVLGFLVIGIISLIVINRFFPDWPHRAPAPVEEVASVVRPVRPAPPPPPPPPAAQATSPVAAVKLMLKASLAGDFHTAYAQWDIEPDDIVTVQRGVPVTLAEQTEEAASVGKRARTEDYTHRLLSQSGTEARVGQYRDNVLTQVYSLRRLGPYWKLYNATTP